MAALKLQNGRPTFLALLSNSKIVSFVGILFPFSMSNLQFFETFNVVFLLFDNLNHKNGDLTGIAVLSSI